MLTYNPGNVTVYDGIAGPFAAKSWSKKILWQGCLITKTRAGSLIV